jgi:hypothetical protein
VAPPVFKTGGRRSASPAGSIPVRLRHQAKRHVDHVALAPFYGYVSEHRDERVMPDLSKALSGALAQPILPDSHDCHACANVAAVRPDHHGLAHQHCTADAGAEIPNPAAQRMRGSFR